MEAKRKQLLVFFALSFIPFISVVYKAAVVSITHDEALTISRYLHLPVSNIVSNNIDGVLPNNHILNTLATKLSSNLLGFSEIALRLPNVLSFVVYLFAAFILGKYLKSNWSKVLLWALLIYFPYLLDFYSLCRGYGMSIAFMMLSLAYFIKYRNDEKNKHLHQSMCFGLLSVFANFSQAYFLLPLVLVSLFIAIVEKKHKQLYITLAWSLLVALLAYVPLSVLINNGTLFGAGSDFWNNTFRSLLIGWLNIYHMQNENLFFAFQWFLTIVLVITTLATLYNAFKRRFLNLSQQQIIVAIPFISILIQWLGNVLFDRHLLSFRVALFLVPLVITGLVFSFNHFFKSKQATKCLGLTLSTLVIGLFFLQVNYKGVLEWEYDQNSKIAFKLVQAEAATKQSNKKTTIGIHWLFEPSLNYYIKQDGKDLIEPVHRWGFKGFDKDYYYVFANDYSEELKQNTEVFKYFESTETYLLKAKH